MNTLKRSLIRIGLLLLLGFFSYLLALNTEPAGVHNDAAQYVSGARNFVAGRGVSSDIAYYDLQHRLGHLPVPITDWPPGFPLLIAMLMAVGIDGFISALMVNYLSLLAIATVGYQISRLLKVRTQTRLATVTILLSYIPAWRFARDGGSSMPMVLCTLLSFCFLLRWDGERGGDQQALPGNSKRDLWWCGIFAGIAFAIRYAGLFYVASLGIYLAIDWFGKRTWDSFRNLIRVVTPIALIVGLILARNIYHVNSLFGRPQSAIHVVEPLSEQVTWTISLLSGISRSAISEANPAAIIALLTAMICLPLCIAGICNARRNGISTTRLPLIYIGFSICSLVGCSAAFQFRFVQPRYLVAVVPFGLILLAESLDRVFDKRSGRFSKWTPTVLLILCCVGQLRTYWYADKSLLRNRSVRSVLQTPIGETTMRQLLQDGTTQKHPLLTDSPQEIALVIDRPTIGIGTADFSRKRLSSNEAREMMELFGARRVLVLKALFDESDSTRSNQPFFADLKNGRIPRWLQTIYADKNVGLYQRIGDSQSPTE